MDLNDPKKDRKNVTLSPVLRVTRALAVLALLLFATAAAASGVRLHNKDGKAYKLYVKHRGSAVHTSIGARTVTNICSSACTIRIKDTGSEISAAPGDKVVIKGGALTRR